MGKKYWVQTYFLDSILQILKFTITELISSKNSC